MSRIVPQFAEIIRSVADSRPGKSILRLTPHRAPGGHPVARIQPSFTGLGDRGEQVKIKKNKPYAWFTLFC